MNPSPNKKHNAHHSRLLVLSFVLCFLTLKQINAFPQTIACSWLRVLEHIARENVFCSSTVYDCIDVFHSWDSTGSTLTSSLNCCDLQSWISFTTYWLLNSWAPPTLVSAQQQLQMGDFQQEQEGRKILPQVKILNRTWAKGSDNHKTN